MSVATGTGKRTWDLQIESNFNGRARTAVVTLKDGDGDTISTHKGDLDRDGDRGKIVKAAAARLAKREIIATEDDVLDRLIERWNGNRQAADEARRRDEEQAKANAVPPPCDPSTVALLLCPPDTIRRPLCVVGKHAYAAAWLHVGITETQSVDPKTGKVTPYVPPRIRTAPVLVIVRDDGTAFGDGPALPSGVFPVEELDVRVCLPMEPHSSRTWTGAGVQRYLAGERPDPADVFHQVAAVVNRFMDFKRSFGSQDTMCELVACYVLASYLLDAFDVAGFLWPNGEKGSGKSNLLYVTCEMAYLGMVVLAGGSFASLRDLADYGGVIAFDDAEGIVDVKKADPDKRSLLLAGNRRGATVTVKELDGERWVTRYISAFCPRMFSAIKLPDDVLGSRTITLPLVRSADRRRSKASPLDHKQWPCDHRQLIDDLWAVGLAHLTRLRHFDEAAADIAKLSGRDLEPWRAILAVALWLQTDHGVAGLFDRLEQLSQDYQRERHDLEGADHARVAVRCLAAMAVALNAGNTCLSFSPTELADRMNSLADAEDLPKKDDQFTSPRKVGWILKRLRIERGTTTDKKRYVITRDEALELAAAYGVLEQDTPPEKPPAENAEQDAASASPSPSVNATGTNRANAERF